MQTIESLKNNAVKALMDMPKDMQMSYALGVIGGALPFYRTNELIDLYKAMSGAIDLSRFVVKP